MEDRRIQQIKYIANKEPTYNKDINQHIESCRISVQVINEQLDTISMMQKMLERRDERIRKLEEQNLLIKREKFIREADLEIQVKELKEVLKEQYKIIEELVTRDKRK